MSQFGVVNLEQQPGVAHGNALHLNRTAHSEKVTPAVTFLLNEFLITDLLLEVLQWFLGLVPVSSLRCFPLRQDLVDLSLQVSVLLLQPLHLAQVVGQSVVQTPQCVFVVRRGGVGCGRSSGRGGVRLIGWSRVVSLVLAQHVAQTLEAGHGRRGAPSSGSTEHTGSRV